MGADMQTVTPHVNRVPFGHTDRLFIDGEWVAPSTDTRIEVIAPATEEPYVSVAAAQDADIRRAVAAARRAFDHGPWTRMTHRERATYLRSIGQHLTERADDVGQVWPNEMGVLHSIARAISGSIGETYEYYAGLAETFLFEERHHPAGGGKLGLLVREPVGVVAAIIPWNAPIITIADKIAPALLAGCCIVLKASPEAPGAAYIMAEVAARAGLPPGVLNVLTADRVASEALVRDPGVDMISFTGSTAVGKRIASICSERVARYALELGGKSAAVILDDFDVETAAQSLVGPACFLSGQVCAALTRIIVNRKRHDQMVEALSARFAAVKVGDPFDPATQIGPVATRRQRDRIEQLIAKGVAEGAQLAVGGKRPAHLERGYYIEPTVFGNVDNQSTIAREEFFGPVLSVIPADSEEHAVELANDTLYGLNNSVFTNDPDRAYQLARRLRSGMVGHNTFRADLSIAFGGFKQSGVGREGGVEGLLPYLESKTLILEAIPSHHRT
jgi:aldehyde dehydrogenase (NAD+)